MSKYSPSVSPNVTLFVDIVCIEEIKLSEVIRMRPNPMKAGVRKRGLFPHRGCHMSIGIAVYRPSSDLGQISGHTVLERTSSAHIMI